MYKNVIDPGKSVSFVLKDIDIGGQIQYLMCTGPLKMNTNFDFQIFFCESNGLKELHIKYLEYVFFV